MAAIGLVAARIIRRSGSREHGRLPSQAHEPVDHALEQRLEQLSGQSTWLDRSEPIQTEPDERPAASPPLNSEPPEYTEDKLFQILWSWSWKRNSFDQWEIAELKPFCSEPSCNRALVAVSSHKEPHGPRTVFLCASQDFSHAIPFEGTEREVRLRVQQIIGRNTDQNMRGDSELAG